MRNSVFMLEVFQMPNGNQIGSHLLFKFSEVLFGEVCTDIFQVGSGKTVGAC